MLLPGNRSRMCRRSAARVVLLPEPAGPVRSRTPWLPAEKDWSICRIEDGKPRCREICQILVLVEQPDHRPLAVDGGKHGQALVGDLTHLIRWDLDPAFLGHVVAIGQEPAKDLQSGDHIVRDGRREPLDGVEHAIQPVFHHQLAAGGLKMHIAGVCLNGPGQQVFHQGDHLGAGHLAFAFDPIVRSAIHIVTRPFSHSLPQGPGVYPPVMTQPSRKS